MRGRHGNQLKGSNHPRWNSEKMLSQAGYVKVRVGVDHPLADRRGYAYEHLLVWTAAGRPKPRRGEVIHHRNEDKTDNRLANFELRTRRHHNAQHNATRSGRQPLTERDVASIRQRRVAGALLKELAPEYRVSIQTISKIARGKLWKT
jgi:hypothetical protein